jgi:hypothetical protein
MFTTFIDDSGSAPEHKMAIAAGIVVPTARIAKLESEWKRLLSEERFSDFHSSECAARNQHSDFANWSDETVQRVFRRVSHLAIRFAVKGFCIGIHKDDYDEVLTPNMKAAVGNSHYTWALSSLLGLALDFATAQKTSMHYVFDNCGKVQREEIVSALEFSERVYPGSFTGHYLFGNRKDMPALQMVDLFAWTCFQMFRHARFQQPVLGIAFEMDEGFAQGRKGEWRIIQSLSREGLEKWVAEKASNPRTQEIIAFKQQRKEARRSKPKKLRN